MGVDISILIGHRLTLQEILHLPAMVSKWEDVTESARGFDDGLHSNIFVRNPHFQPHWYWEGDGASDFVLTEERVLLCWEFSEAEEDSEEWPEIFQLTLHCALGWIDVNRHTLCIRPYQHKWANLRDADTRQYILATARLIAAHLGQRRVLYCVDSAFPSAHLQELSYEGWELEAIEAYGNAQFGVPSQDWDADDVDFYFVDGGVTD